MEAFKYEAKYKTVIWVVPLKWPLCRSQGKWQDAFIWLALIKSPLSPSQGNWQHPAKADGSYKMASSPNQGKWQDAVIWGFDKMAFKPKPR